MTLFDNYKFYAPYKIHVNNSIKLSLKELRIFTNLKYYRAIISKTQERSIFILKTDQCFIDNGPYQKKSEQCHQHIERLSLSSTLF